MNNADLKAKLSKTLEHLKNELGQIRTGRGSPALLVDIQVEAYGSKMSLKEVGSISVLDPQNLVVTPWDKSLIQAVGKAIMDSDLKLNPVVESSQVRVPIPALTEERRKEFAKVVSSKVEETKNSMRSIRQDAMKDVEKAFTDKLIGEDEKFTQKDDVEKIVKDYVSQADTLGDDKKADIMSL